MRRRSALVAAACTVAALGVAAPARAYWGVGSTNATGAAAASTLGTPTVSTSRITTTNVTVDVTAAPPAGLTPTGYRVARTGPGTAVTTVCTVTGSTGSCNDSAPVTGQTNTYAVYARYTAGGANWESYDPATAAAVVNGTDTTPPTNALSLIARTGAFLSGSGASYTLYYRGSAAGSFTLVDTVTDTGSGPASANFPALTAGGWTHAAETVTAPSGGPYPSSAFSWTANPASPAAYQVTAADVAGNAAGATVTFTSDVTAPSGGSISYADGWYRTASVAVTTVDGTDSGSGLDTSSRTVQRASAPLTNGACGTFGAFATVTLTGGSDASVSGGTCYTYQLLVSDNVGNQATYRSTSVAKVDTAGPQVVAVTSSDGDGVLETGDSLVVTFDEPVDPASVTGSVTVTESKPSSGVTVKLTVPGVTSGAVDTGSGTYLQSGNRTATAAATVSVSGSTVTVTITGPVTGDTPTAGSGALAFVPAATLKDLAGNTATGTFTTAGTFRLF